MNTLKRTIIAGFSSNEILLVILSIDFELELDSIKCTSDNRFNYKNKRMRYQIIIISRDLISHEKNWQSGHFLGHWWSKSQKEKTIQSRISPTAPTSPPEKHQRSKFQLSPIGTTCRRLEKLLHLKKLLTVRRQENRLRKDPSEFSEFNEGRIAISVGIAPWKQLSKRLAHRHYFQERIREIRVLSCWFQYIGKFRRQHDRLIRPHLHSYIIS